jgi:hypothetical protein
MSIVVQSRTVGNLTNALPSRMTEIIVPRVVTFKKPQELIQVELIPEENEPSNFYFCKYTGKSGAIIAAILLSQQINVVSVLQNEHFYTEIKLSKLNQPSTNPLISMPSVDIGKIAVDETTKIETEEKIELEKIFTGLAKRWKEETRGYSITSQKYAHSAYQSILVLGPEVVPFILRDLQTNGGRWFEALKALTKRDDIAKPSDTYEDAVKAWVAWGKEKRLI